MENQPSRWRQLAAPRLSLSEKAVLAHSLSPQSPQPPLLLKNYRYGPNFALSSANYRLVLVSPLNSLGFTTFPDLQSPSGVAAVLYPASAKAADTLVTGLEARNFDVTRLDTYTTEPAAWDSDLLAAAKAANVVTLASPSAVQVWADRVGTATPAACIGETSGAASRRAGFTVVEWPDKPGMDGWVGAIMKIQS